MDGNWLWLCGNPVSSRYVFLLRRAVIMDSHSALSASEIGVCRSIQLFAAADGGGQWKARPSPLPIKS